MNISNLYSIKGSEPERFWREITNALLEEYKSEKFLSILRELLGIEFLKQKEESKQLPYHMAYYLQDAELQFRYFVQVLAQNENEMPLPIITGILPFSGEQCYTFHIHHDGNGCEEVDVFVPHMIDRYARRAYLLPTNLPIPKTWHKEKRQRDEVAFNDKEIKRLFYIVGKFFAHNKISRLCKNEKALSFREQGISQDDCICLWMDGLTYCKPFCNNRVWLHKTFVPYWNDATTKDEASINNDQLQAISKDLNILFSEAKKTSPQYKDGNLSELQYMELCRKLWHSLKDEPTTSISEIQDSSFDIINECEKLGFIKVNRKTSTPPTFSHKEISETIDFITNLDVESNKCDIKELAKHLLVCWSTLWWSMRAFDEWDTEAAKHISDEEGLLVIMLKRGVDIRDKILNLRDLLSKLSIATMNSLKSQIR